LRRIAVFLDRDGTLIRDVHYLHKIEQVTVLPGVAQALRLLRGAGLRLVMITNQSAVARGYLSEASLQEIHKELAKRLESAGARLDAVYYCPHHPTEGMGDYRTVCDCRKPKTGMIKRATAELGLDPKSSFMVGDQIIDMELAAAVGARGVLLDPTGDGSYPITGSDFPIVADLAQAAQWILDHLPHVASREQAR